MSKFILLSSAGEKFSTKIQSNIPYSKNTNHEKAGQGRRQEEGLPPIGMLGPPPNQQAFFFENGGFGA